MTIHPSNDSLIATTGMGGLDGYGYATVEKAQLWVAGVARSANVRSTDTRPFCRESTESPASQGHHSNWNAQSYFLIGKSMGDNMVDRLTP